MLALELDPANPRRAKVAVDKWHSKRSHDPGGTKHEIFVFEKKKQVPPQLGVHRFAHKVPLEVRAAKKWCLPHAPCYKATGKFRISYSSIPSEAKVISDIHHLLDLISSDAAAIVIGRLNDSKIFAARGYLLKGTRDVSPKNELEARILLLPGPSRPR